MMRLLIPALAGVLLAGGVVVAQSQEATVAPPQEVAPAPDPIGDILKETSPVAPAPAVAPVAPAPAATVAAAPEKADDEDEADDDATAPVAVKAKLEAVPPGRRQRRPVAIIQAIDKITAETMRFEVEVGGRPVRFNGSLIFTARACEVSASDELVNDSVAYVEISVQPRGMARDTAPREIFKGWMFASTPAVSGLEHPVYDAWVVGCKA